MADDTWSTTELPVLEAIRQAEVDGSEATMDVVAERSGFDEDTVRKSLLMLHDAEYVSGIDATSHSSGSRTQAFTLLNIALTPWGRRAVGQWPGASDSYDGMIQLLRRAIDEESDPGRKSRLQKMLGALVDVGKDVGSTVLSAWLKQTMGLP